MQLQCVFAEWPSTHVPLFKHCMESQWSVRVLTLYRIQPTKYCFIPATVIFNTTMPRLNRKNEVNNWRDIKFIVYYKIFGNSVTAWLGYAGSYDVWSNTGTSKQVSTEGTSHHEYFPLVFCDCVCVHWFSNSLGVCRFPTRSLQTGGWKLTPPRK